MLVRSLQASQGPYLENGPQGIVGGQGRLQLLQHRHDGSAVGKIDGKRLDLQQRHKCQDRCVAQPTRNTITFLGTMSDSKGLLVEPQAHKRQRSTKIECRELALPQPSTSGRSTSSH